MKKITAILIDNEPDAREVISGLLAELFAEITVIGEADGVKSGTALVEKRFPDVLFLDVEMDDGSGFDLIKNLDEIPITIFVTGHEKYAIQAIKAAAFDYLVKPVNREEFMVSVNKALRKVDQKRNSDLLRGVQSGGPAITKIGLPQMSGLKFIDAHDIIRCEADGNYTYVYLKSGNRELITRPLGKLQLDLSPTEFMRVHHRHLVNLNYVTAYQKGKGGGWLNLENGEEVEVSVRRKSDVLRRLAPGTDS